MKSLIPWRKNSNHAAPVQMDHWFDRIWDNPFEDFLPTFSYSSFGSMPSVDVSEGKKEVTVTAEIPGMTEKDIDLTWHNGVLNIRGEKKEEKEDKKKNSYYRECRYGSFSRDIMMNDTVDWSRAKAKYKNGVLSVTMPKAESALKAIEIKVN